MFLQNWKDRKEFKPLFQRGTEKITEVKSGKIKTYILVPNACQQGVGKLGSRNEKKHPELDMDEKGNDQRLPPGV